MNVVLYFTWDGDTMVPWEKFSALCSREFVVGQGYRMDVIEDRSQASHSHYFARLHDLWHSLPERFAVQFPTVEHLRKHALCMTGHRNERSFVCATKAEATRLAAFMRPSDDYAIISQHEAAIVVWTAKSQSNRAMGREVFQKSKEDVLGFIEDLIGIEPFASRGGRNEDHSVKSRAPSAGRETSGGSHSTPDRIAGAQAATPGAVGRGLGDDSPGRSDYGDDLARELRARRK